MLSLGVETTAHTFGIGIVTDEGKILVNEKDTYIPPIGKGIIPIDAAKHHEKVKEKVLAQALEKSKEKLENVDVISYSAGPGLPPALRVGADFAIGISKKYKKKLIPVNHSLAHLEIGRLTSGTKDPVFVYLSGGNTMIIAYAGGRYRIFGETEDIPVGNCFDVVGREMGLPHPGGPEIEKLALNGEYVELPYVVKGMDLSFAGIATAATKLFKNGVSKENISYSLQETCFAMLTEVTERAMAHTGKKELLLVGGVAANKRLQEMMKMMCEDRSAKFYVVPSEYSGDQGAMIAWCGILASKSKWKSEFKDKIKPNWRIDQVKINWL